MQVQIQRDQAPVHLLPHLPLFSALHKAQRVKEEVDGELTHRAGLLRRRKEGCKCQLQVYCEQGQHRQRGDTGVTATSLASWAPCSPYVLKKRWEAAGQLQSHEAELPPVQEPQQGAEHWQGRGAGAAVRILQLLHDARQQAEHFPRLREEHPFLLAQQRPLLGQNRSSCSLPTGLSSWHGAVLAGRAVPHSPGAAGSEGMGRELLLLTVSCLLLSSRMLLSTSCCVPTLWLCR